jgi:rare lipoprotein A
MKRISVLATVLGLMSVPALAGNPTQDGANASAQLQAPVGGSQTISQNFFSISMPQNARSFVANASFYGGGPRRFEPNSHTASGERFNQWGLTAAHRTLPLGTRLLVTHRGRSVVVRVNDRGPAAWTGRSLDLSRGAATAIGLVSSGTGPVQVQVLTGS